MNTRIIALKYIKRARRRLNESKAAFGNEDYLKTIEKGHISVQLSLQAVLRTVAVEMSFNKHDINDAFEIVNDKFPDWFSVEIPDFIRISRNLNTMNLRIIETNNKPAYEIFSKMETEEALMQAKKVFDSSKKLIYDTFEQWAV